jgi:hypothetical protein
MCPRTRTTLQTLRSGLHDPVAPGADVFQPLFRDSEPEQRLLLITREPRKAVGEGIGDQKFDLRFLTYCRVSNREWMNRQRLIALSPIL